MSEIDQSGDPQGAPPIEIVPTSDNTPISPRDAANALAQYRYKRDAGEERAAAKAAEPAPDLPAEQPSEAPAAEQATEATETEAASDAELPPIEPPRSWSKEWKEEFQSYPREVQEKIAQREQERDAGFRRGQNEAAEQRKAAEAERQQLEQVRQQYEKALPTLLTTLQQAQAGEFSDIKTIQDVEKLAREDWPRYALWDAHQKKIAAVQQEIQVNQQRQQQEFEAKRAEHREKQNALFFEAHPELAKPEVAEKVTSDAVSYLKVRGITQAELDEMSKGLDARWQEIIYDASRYHQAKAAVPKAAVPKPVPKVQRPGTPTERASDKDVELAALNKKLDSGDASWRDGADFLIARRAASRR